MPPRRPRGMPLTPRCGRRDDNHLPPLEDGRYHSRRQTDPAPNDPQKSPGRMASSIASGPALCGTPNASAATRLPVRASPANGPAGFSAGAQYVALQYEELVEHRDSAVVVVDDGVEQDRLQQLGLGLLDETPRPAACESRPAAAPSRGHPWAAVPSAWGRARRSPTLAGTSTTMSSGSPGIAPRLGMFTAGRSRSTPHATHSMIGIASSSDDSTGRSSSSDASSEAAGCGSRNGRLVSAKRIS